ncbi:MAG TPA: hypothetical protein H9889_09585 [Candidatus Ignatzschineria merdigallinarum]|uniref:Protein YibB n=1 Tax=Candidatus Ignatzschineria merdigallinarum TaxID=2838621 RepID=A0A9D1Q8F6_9GAMM|nr:hypothetical protein [Candidatus Ignatzschineria merdigallinarum]
MGKSITIVTAFFDIGRGSWKEKGKSYGRGTDIYFRYFKQLAVLENKMVIFTSREFVEKIKKIRGNKPTTVITIDFERKFKRLLSKLAIIQQSSEFQNLIHPENLGNPECWSPEYLLINNLKYYFINEAIKLGINASLIAWIDFGYFREKSALAGVMNWYHPFSAGKMHLFTICDDFVFKDTQNSVQRALDNKPVIIGGAMIADVDTWQRFYVIASKIQQKYMNKKIVDDDQGVLLLAVTENPELFKLHYLGKDNWFYLFGKYHSGSKIKFLNRFFRAFSKK